MHKKMYSMHKDLVGKYVMYNQETKKEKEEEKEKEKVGKEHHKHQTYLHDSQNFPTLVFN